VISPACRLDEVSPHALLHLAPARAAPAPGAS
jgi:hypothetical protein